MKYLFTAEFEDNSVILQEDDVSTVDPKKSRFYDVLQEAEKQPLIGFVIKGDGHTYGVDLRDGHFEVDGVPFFMHENRTLKDFRIIYFRQHTRHFNAGSGEQIGHQIVFRIGWQCTKDGQNFQEVLEVD